MHYAMILNIEFSTNSAETHSEGVGRIWVAADQTDTMTTGTN